jgi:hypothetical protein
MKSAIQAAIGQRLLDKKVQAWNEDVSAASCESFKSSGNEKETRKVTWNEQVELIVID